MGKGFKTAAAANTNDNAIDAQKQEWRVKRNESFGFLYLICTYQVHDSTAHAVFCACMRMRVCAQAVSTHSDSKIHYAEFFLVVVLFLAALACWEIMECALLDDEMELICAFVRLCVCVYFLNYIELKS